MRLVGSSKDAPNSLDNAFRGADRAAHKITSLYIKVDTALRKTCGVHSREHDLQAADTLLPGSRVLDVLVWAASSVLHGGLQVSCQDHHAIAQA